MSLEALPFQLTEATMPNVVLRVRVSSTRAFSGYDEIFIRGNGQVGLRAALRNDAEPKIRVGAVDKKLITRLLQYVASEGFEGWDDVYPSPSRDYVGTVIAVLVNDASAKRVAVCQPEFAEFSRAIGAIKLVASMAAPEATDGTFFQWL